jgi:hypothetical protein
MSETETPSSLRVFGTVASCGRAPRHRDVGLLINEVDLFQGLPDGGATAPRTHFSTALWPCVPNSRWQRFTGSSRSQAVKRTNGSIKNNILIWL